MTANLPPPVVFKHKETLHRIELPPLAQFLHSLTVPAHLIRLNDILDRYRTPSSVHRVDIREVESSELPLGGEETQEPTPALHQAAGQPIELEEGLSIEDYRVSRAVRSVPTDDAPSPEATHSLPPSGPRRRLRELRVDLRSLDAAALFALEKWRRQVLQLDDLPFDHPDSIWYQSEPTPEPEPEPTSSSAAKRPVVRPRKSTKSASVQMDAALGKEVGETPNGIPRTQAVPGGVSEPATSETINGVEELDAMLDNLESVTGSVPSLGRGEMEQIEEAGSDNLGVTAPVVISDDEARSRSPTPDQLLADGFDVNADDDSDYAPELTPPPHFTGNADTIPSPPLPAPSVKPAFTKMPIPVPIGLAKTVDPVFPPVSGFTRVPSPLPMMAIASGSRPRNGQSGSSARRVIESRPEAPLSPTRRISLSPSRRSISPDKRQRTGTSSEQPIELSASPEQYRPPPTKAQPAFVPFIREQMRVPDSVANGRSRPTWLHDSADQAEGGDEVRSRLHGAGKKGVISNKRPRKSRIQDRDARMIADNGDKLAPPHRPAAAAESDEWADFRF